MLMMHCCKSMRDFVADERLPIDCLPKFREYGLGYLDGVSLQGINFCPWCGCRLPASLRHEWFDRIEALGLDPDSDVMPLDFQSDRWWQVDEE